VREGKRESESRFSPLFLSRSFFFLLLLGSPPLSSSK